MSVLSQPRGGEIRLPGKITLSIAEIDGNRVRLLVRAPAGVPIRRHEPPQTHKPELADGLMAGSCLD